MPDAACPNSEHVNAGRLIEDAVEYLCTRSFFADFTIRSPKYYKSNRQQKEAADLLIVFKDTLLAIQIKSKEFDGFEHIAPIELERVTRTVQKTILQFRALFEAMRNPTFNSVVNGRGVEVAFDKCNVTDIILIVIFAPVNKGGSKKPSRIRFDVTCYPEGKIPIHLFTLEQFSLLLTLLDTLPDFVLYLLARWTLHEQKLIPENSDPIDEWALVTFERKKVIEILERRTFTDLSGLFERHRISIQQLERREQPSYLIDWMIEQLYSSIGSDISVDARFKLIAEPNSLNAYHFVIPQLAKLDRNERSRFTEFLLRIVNRSHKKEIAFRGFKFSEQSDEAYVVLAAELERNERRIVLSNVARGVGFSLNVKTVVGMAVGHDWPKSKVFDVIFIDVSKISPDADFLKVKGEVFGKIRLEDP